MVPQAWNVHDVQLGGLRQSALRGRIMRMRIAAAIVLSSLLAIAGGAAGAATGPRAGCMVANMQFGRRPVTLYLSTTSLKWTVRSNSSFLVLDTQGNTLTVDENTETWVLDANGAPMHPRRPLGIDQPAAQWKGSTILKSVSKDSCPLGMGWVVLYK